MREHSRARIASLAAGIGLLGALVATAVALASELGATAEVSGTTVAGITVEQGDTGSFDVRVGVSGNAACGATSSAKVNTAYAIDSAGAVSGGTPSGVMNFASPGTATNCPAVKTDAAAAYLHAAEVSVDAATAPGEYTVPITFTDVTNSNSSQGKLGDATAQSITVTVTEAEVGDPDPVNTDPTVETAATDANGVEGDTLASSGAFSDDDADALTLTADNAEGTFTDNGDGTWDWSMPTDDDVAGGTITVTADDGNDGTATDSFDYSAANADPAIGALSLSSSNCDPELTVPFTDAGSADTHVAAIDWGDGSAVTDVDPAASGFTESHHYSSAGTYTVEVTVTDDDDGSDSDDTLSHGVVNAASGILQPINANGSSVFKSGSTIPVKIRISDCDGAPVGGLGPSVAVSKVNSGVDSGSNEEISSTSSADTGTQMRWDPTAGQYIYNLSTKGLVAPATYRVKVSDASLGSTASSDFGIKK